MRSPEPSPRLVWLARFAARLCASRPGVDATLARLYAECAYPIDAARDAERAADEFLAVRAAPSPARRPTA